jgi:fibronectin type 3 domain-containing protein
VGAPDSTKTSFTDKNVTSGIKYKYTVKAVNDKVKSTFTASATLVRLAQPTVTIANAKTGVTVKWNKITGATDYKIYRQELVNGKWSNWASKGTVKSSKTSWTDTNAESGATYRYTVRAVNGKSLSSYTATGNLMFLSEPNVKIKNASNGIKVSWNLVEGATGYTVYRSEYNAKTKKWSGWSNRGTAKAGKSSWTDKKVTSGVQYKYTVRAINGNFKSTYTSSGKLIYLAQPVVTSAKTTSGIVVKWTKSGGATSYIVYRQEMTDGAWSKWESELTTKAKVNSYTDKTVEEGKEYRYTVRAVNGKYKSTYEASNSVKR